MKKCAMLFAILCMMLLIGCSGTIDSLLTDGPGGTQNTSSKDAVFKQVQLGAPQPLTPIDTGDKPYAEACAKANTFGFSLAEKLYKKDKNLLVSPLSVYLALSCISNATAGEAEKQLEAALYPKGFSEEQFNKANATLLGFLLQDTAKPLEIVALVCTDDELVPGKAFAGIAQDYYRGETAYADFDKPGAKDAINAWAEEKTKGLIKGLLDKDPLPETVCILANSLYFSGRWYYFDDAKTVEQVFKGAARETKAPFMTYTGDIDYYEDDSIQACRLKFTGSSQMTVILPKEGTGVDSIVRDMDGYQKKLKDMPERKGTLKLPRFGMDNSNDLVQPLKELGLTAMFDSRVDSFGSLLEKPILLPVYISEVFQRARVEVDEKGTTAAAVTVAVAPGASMPPPNEELPFQMTVDRPFVFLLTERVREDEAVLFIGVVNDPGQ